MKKTLLATLSLSLVLAACDWTGPTGETTSEPTTVSGYQELSGNVIGNGEKSVLFFHAAWCPMCQQKDQKLAELYSSQKIPVKTYRVDYDTSDSLKQLYGVGMQDTFVLIDENGDALKKEVAPSFTKVKRLLFLNLEEAKAMEADDAMEGDDKMAMEKEDVGEAMEAMEKEDIGDAMEAMVKEEEMEEGDAMEAMEKEEAPLAMEKIEEDSVDKMVMEKPTVAAAGSYSAFADGVIGNGKTSVLFFHAAWCPKCKANDGILSDLYGSEQFPRSVYKVDFDASTDLRAKYGVTGQDTFIVIDGSGNEVERTRFPSPSALRDLLG